MQKDKFIIEKYARGKEAFLIESYILNGPTELSEKIGVGQFEWQIIFDYLVFEHNLLYKCITYSSDFFLDLYIKHGMEHIREILDVTGKKYDAILEVVFDFLSISKEGFYYHFLQHRDKYAFIFKVRGGDVLRKVLGITKNKYDEHWGSVLDLLLNTVCEELFTDQTFDKGLRAFAYLLNGMREHRPVAKSEIFRDFSKFQ